MQIEFRISKDGSHTLFLPHLNETYHSLHGAIQESEYVFLEQGVQQLTKTEITILEVGFGTGLNALLTLMYSIQKKIKVSYFTLEPFPLPSQVYEKLNYIALLKAEHLKDDFLKMHAAPHGNAFALNEFFTFSRHLSSLENFSLPGLEADVVYYDAFAPSKQPEVWSLNNLKKCRDLMNSSGMLVTYCASGQFKRDLKEAGFKVEVLFGPPGKKEMTRGLLSF